MLFSHVLRDGLTYFPYFKPLYGRKKKMVNKHKIASSKPQISIYVLSVTCFRENLVICRI